MINVVVEGESDREAAKAVARAAGRQVDKIRITGGKGQLDKRLPKYNAAARQRPWVVFRDSDAACPVELTSRLIATLIQPSPMFSLRIAHSMVEAWLIADRKGIADFIGVSTARVPRDPESLRNAKQSLLNLLMDSGNRALRRDMVTDDGKTGPLYVARLNEFAGTKWDVEVAAEVSPSLGRAIVAIEALP